MQLSLPIFANLCGFANVEVTDFGKSCAWLVVSFRPRVACPPAARTACAMQVARQRALLLLIAWACSPIAEARQGGAKSAKSAAAKGGNGGLKPGGRRKKKSVSAVQQRGTALGHTDSGARYRMRLHGNPTRYLYQHGEAIVAHRAFFSLFRWQPLGLVESGGATKASGDGAHLLGDHAGARWLTMVEPRAVAGAQNGQARQWLALGSTVANATRSYAHPLWARASPRPGCPACVTLHLDSASTSAALALDPAAQTQSLIAGAAATAGVFEMQLVLPPTRQRATANGLAKQGDESSFAERVRRSVTSLHGRSFLLVTYHNVGMLDWAALFWQWLRTAGLRRFLLLELDGQTCDAARALNASRHVHFECATARDMQTILPASYTAIRGASSMQEWGTNADSGYFKFLRWKLAIVEKLLGQGVDVLMADVDVLVLSPSFFATLATSKYDLTISSDARAGAYSDNHHCPCSHPMYQRFAADWVCAGLFYMRSTKSSLWFIREVQALMDEFVITDQDAFQAVLTGHTQVAVPQAKVSVTDPNYNATLARFRGYPRGYRPSQAWLKPLWLEGLEPGQTLRNMRGIQPLNTPMRPGMWERVTARRRANGFTWTTASLTNFANGPVVFDQWQTTFSKRRLRDDNYASVHANCNVKTFLAEERNSDSFLLHPPDPPTS